MLRFKSWRKSPALTQETTPSQRRITRILSEAQQAAAREMDAALPQVAEALSRGQVDRVLSMLPTEPWLEAQEALAEELLGELLDAGSRVQLPTIEKATAEFSFDRGRPESAQWARYAAGALITQITYDQREVVRNIVSLAASGTTATPYGGIPFPGQRPVDWTQVARTVRGTIGLTTQQAGWVANHYDRAYTAAIRNGASMGQAAALAARSADRYQTSVHRYRANTIARTETMRAASEGRVQAWGQGMAQGFIDPLWQKEWIAESDACDICQAIDGKRIGVKDSFPVGEPPAHPNCRCDVLLVPPKAQPPQAPAAFPTDLLPFGDLFAPVPSVVPLPTFTPPPLRPEDLPIYAGPLGQGWLAQKPTDMSPEDLTALTDEIAEEYRSVYEEILWDADLVGMPTEYEDLDDVGVPRTEADYFYEETPDGVVLRIMLSGWWRGEQIFSATRMVNLTTGVVDHVEFMVSKQYQGTGIGWQAHEALIDLYRRNGIRYVDTYANIDVGGYTWAKFGFDWADRYGPDVVQYGDAAAYQADRAAALDRLRNEIDNRLERIRDRVLTSDPGTALDEIDEYQDRLLGPVEEWPTPAELAAIGWFPGAATWPGKAAMLRSKWNGRLYL